MSANCCQTVRFPTPARSAIHEARGRRSPSPCSVRIASTIARRVRCDLAARPSAGKPSANSPRMSARSSLASSVARIETRRSSGSEENGASEAARADTVTRKTGREKAMYPRGLM